MRNISLLLVFSCLILFCLNSACTQTRHSINTTTIEKLPDGIYAVEQTAVELAELKPVKPPKVIIDYNHKFLFEGQQTIQKLVINSTEWVPLSLQFAPEKVAQDDGRSRLMLTLSKSARRQLKQFSKKHLNGQVAIVIGGEAVTLHKIRTVLTGGQVQITRCTDNACEYLFVELQDNVQQ